MADAVNMI